MSTDNTIPIFESRREAGFFFVLPVQRHVQAVRVIEMPPDQNTVLQTPLYTYI
jgi:hypothetical protein